MEIVIRGTPEELAGLLAAMYLRPEEPATDGTAEQLALKLATQLNGCLKSAHTQ